MELRKETKRAMARAAVYRSRWGNHERQRRTRKTPRNKTKKQFTEVRDQRFQPYRATPLERGDRLRFLSCRRRRGGEGGEKGKGGVRRATAEGNRGGTNSKLPGHQSMTPSDQRDDDDVDNDVNHTATALTVLRGTQSTSERRMRLCGVLPL